MNVYTDTFATPFGPFSLAVTDSVANSKTAAPALLATAFGPLSALRPRLKKCHVIRDTSPTRLAREQVLRYCAGELREFALPFAEIGTPFQRRVWSALRHIPFGETRSYGQLAAAIGHPAAARAVGRANATNPLCLIVPCHRVIGADGSLTGFAFGEPLKRQLLAHERTFLAQAA